MPSERAMEAARALVRKYQYRPGIDNIAAAIDAAVLAEREACLRLVEYGRGASWTAAAIRNRSTDNDA